MLREVLSNRKPIEMLLALRVNQSIANVLSVFMSPLKIRITEVRKVSPSKKLHTKGASQATLSLMKKLTHADSNGKLSVISANRKGEA